MMNHDPLEELLVSAWKELAQYIPEEAAYVARHRELEHLLKETDDKGNPTVKGHRAGVRLRNAFLVEETNAKSKGKVLKNQAKLEKELAQAFSTVLKLLVAARGNAAKIAHIDSVEERQIGGQKPRERHDPESRFALASPFIDKLAQAGTSPSAIGRMPGLMVSFIALMIKDHAADPKLANPDNIWNRIVRAGILEAYLGNLDEDHLKVVALAACERDEQMNDWAKKAREELELPAGMEDLFLEGSSRIRDAARSLTEGEVRAYNDAFDAQDDRDVDRLGKLLQMEKQEDRIRLRVMIDFVRRAIGPLRRDWKLQMHLSILKREIDAIAPHAKWHKDWKSELHEKLGTLFERLGPMGSIEAFNALLKSGLAASDADWEFTKRLERDVLDGRLISIENRIRAACMSDRYFKVYEGRVAYSHEPDFEEIDAQVWTGHLWLQEFGTWPGEDREQLEPRPPEETSIQQHSGEDTQTFPEDAAAEMNDEEQAAGTSAGLASSNEEVGKGLVPHSNVHESRVSEAEVSIPEASVPPAVGQCKDDDRADKELVEKGVGADRSFVEHSKLAPLDHDLGASAQIGSAALRRGPDKPQGHDQPTVLRSSEPNSSQKLASSSRPPGTTAYQLDLIDEEDDWNE